MKHTEPQIPMNESPIVMEARRPPHGFTLVELLVVITIIGILIALLLPAVQAAREAARRAACGNNLKQFALAVANFESQQRHYPPSGQPTLPDSNGNIHPWSAQALILPFLEQSGLHSMIDLTQSYEMATNTQLAATRVPTYVCPSEIRDEVRFSSSGAPQHYPLNYVVNLGTWFVYDPQTQRGGDGAFYYSSRLTTADMRDGLSFTLLAAEVKAWQPYYRNAALSSDPGIPLSTAVCSLGGQFKQSSGHTEWVDGRVHQTGFTTAFPPNTKVLCQVDGVDYDVDWTNQQEGKSATISTFGAVTARSYHPGGVHVARMDGSIHWVSDSIDGNVWQGISTRDGQEVISTIE